MNNYEWSAKFLLKYWTNLSVGGLPAVATLLKGLYIPDYAFDLHAVFAEFNKINRTIQ